MTYKVYVEGKFCTIGESERYCAGRYRTANEALVRCREIIRKSVENCRKPGMSAEDLYRAYVDFGDDPWIVGVKFSAWTYAKHLAAEMCEK